MAKHLFRDLEELKRAILNLGSLVEQAIQRATVALAERRASLADEVIVGDQEIDAREVRIEDDCLKALALHQPVARDLRFIITVLKVNNDLERMGDLAANIAARAKALASMPPLPIPPEIVQMMDSVREMVRDSLDALVNLDTNLAQKVYSDDDLVDRLHEKMFSELQTLMSENPDTIGRATHLLSVSRALERIADLATNIAEDVEFMVDGEIIRHRKDRP